MFIQSADTFQAMDPEIQMKRAKIVTYRLCMNSYKRILTSGRRKKSSFLSGRATKRGWGLNGCATKEKRIYFLMFLWPLSRGGGAKSLSGRATKKITFFFAASLTYWKTCKVPKFRHTVQRSEIYLSKHIFFSRENNVAKIVNGLLVMKMFQFSKIDFVLLCTMPTASTILCLMRNSRNARTSLNASLNSKPDYTVGTKNLTIVIVITITITVFMKKIIVFILQKACRTSVEVVVDTEKSQISRTSGFFIMRQ